MDYCGLCAHYLSRPFEENICTKTGKIVPYLKKRECFVPRETNQITTDMEEQITSPAEETTVPATKICKECGRELPITEFGKHHRTADGLQPRCHDCMSKRMSKVARQQKSVKEKEAEVMAVESMEPMITKISLTDEALVAELRSRGWEVKCTKTIEL